MDMDSSMADSTDMDSSNKADNTADKTGVFCGGPSEIEQAQPYRDYTAQAGKWVAQVGNPVDLAALTILSSPPFCICITKAIYE